MGITRQFVYRVNLDPTIGHEIDKERPCLVISPTAFNNNSGLVTIVPLTDRKVGTIHSNQVEVTVADGCVDKLRVHLKIISDFVKEKLCNSISDEPRGILC